MGCWEYDEGNGWKTDFVVHTGSCAVRAGSRSIRIWSSRRLVIILLAPS